MERDNEFPNLMAVLQEYGAALRNLYQDKLILADKIATGELLNNVNYEVTVEGTVYKVSLDLLPYWKDIEGGIKPAGEYENPGWKALLPIRQWITAKPVLPRPQDGRLPSPDTLAFLITRKIVNEGIEPHPFYAESVEDVNAHYKPLIIEAFRKDTYTTLRDIAFRGLGL